jgi:GAF domain-containing protein
MSSDDAPARSIGAVLAEFATAMVEDSSTAAVLERLGNYCTELLPVHGVGVLLRAPKGGGLEVATANTEAGRIVEGLEAQLHQGPCTESLESGEQVLVPDLAATADRYPQFTPRALEAGVRSIHALPLTIRGETIGSMDLIALETMDLDAGQLAVAQLLGDVTVSYLANGRVLAEKTALAEQLQQALDSRVLIEQAKGVIAERRKVQVNEAFETIRRYARSNQLKLRDVAAAIVRGDLDL